MPGDDGLILGIETSCDDTAAAVVGRDGRVLSACTAGQVETHALYGGVYPELASRLHVAAVVPVVAQALRQAGVRPADLAAIGVTRGPGLIGSLLVGLNAAAGLGLAWDRPVIGVNHLRGHLRSADLQERRVLFPATVLLVSGGHSLLAHMPDARTVRLLGETRDDSVGEAYDKVGRMLGLDYPAGPAVDRLAARGRAVLPFPRPMIADGLEFSFSGLKSAVARVLAANDGHAPEDIAASFVAACMDVLIAKCRRALAACPSVSLVVVGGVAASPQLRAAAAALCADMRVTLCLPPVGWSTDNAAMIALATWDYLDLGISPPPVVQTGLSLTEY